MGPRQIRVVFVTTVFEGVDTGPGTYARYLWSAFRDDPEIDFHLVAPEISERHPRLHASGLGTGPLSLYRRVQETGRSIAAKSNGVTIVHGNSTHGMGRFVGYPGPLIVQVNDYDTANFPQRAWRILRQRGPRRLLGSVWRYGHEGRVLRYATLAMCNSQYTAAEIQRVYGVPRDRVRVVYKAVDTAAFGRPASLPTDPVAGRPVGSRLVFVGTNWRQKGLDVLLDAAARMAPDNPDVLLSVIGPDRNDPKLRALIEERGLADRVILVGRSSAQQVAGYLWHSDVFVLPSRHEALGVALLEAMAAGLPVVATRVGGIPEIIRSDDEGLLVAPDDAASLARAVMKLLSDPARRSTIRVAGQRRAQHFSIHAMLEAVRNVYRSLTDGGRERA